MDQKASNTNRKKHKIISFLNIFQRPKLMWAFNAALALIVVIFGVTTIAASSLPGDILYPVKLATDKVKFLLTFDPREKGRIATDLFGQTFERNDNTFSTNRQT